MNDKRSHLPFIIGLCGGIASGKSVVANELERLGALVIHADQIGHQVLAEDDIKQKLIAFFGSDILDSTTGELSRPKIAAVVFGSSSQARENLRYLESVTHPRIRERILQKLQELKTEETFPKTVVLDIPLLLESGWDRLCQEIIFVATPESARIQHASSRGWSPDDYLARQAMQMSLAEKEKRSSVVFNNTGTLEDLRSQVSHWFQETLRKLRE